MLGEERRGVKREYVCLTAAGIKDSEWLCVRMCASVGSSYSKVNVCV